MIICLILFIIVPFVHTQLFVVSIENPLDDVTETAEGAMINARPFIEHGKNGIGAYRFRLDIPKEASINHAFLQMKYNWGDGLGLLQISVEDSSDAPIISSHPYNISGRLYGPKSSVFEVDIKQYGQVIYSPDISNLVSSIIENDDWQRNNYILFRISNLNPQSNTEFIAFEGSRDNLGALSVQLIVEYTFQKDTYTEKLKHQQTSYQTLREDVEKSRKACLTDRENSKKKPLMFVVDDLQTSYLEQTSFNIANLHIQEEVDILLNVIPNNINTSYLLQYSLKYWQENYPCLIEIGEHGFTHQGIEYQMDILSLTQQKDIIIKGFSALDSIGLTAKSFTPPGGRENSFTFKALKEFGFQTSIDWYKKSENVDTSDIMLIENGFLCEGSNGNIIGPECKIKNGEQLQKQIDEQIQRLGYGCIGYHIQDFSDYVLKTDIGKIEAFRESLGYLKSLEKYEIMLPDEYYQLHKE